jgi:hypothetical protein
MRPGEMVLTTVCSAVIALPGLPVTKGIHYIHHRLVLGIYR